MDDDRFMMAGYREEDSENELSLRPRNLREYIGQDAVKQNLSITKPPNG